MPSIIRDQPVWVEHLDDVVSEGRRKERLSPQLWMYPVLLVILVLFIGFLIAHFAPYFAQVTAWVSRML